MSVVVHEGRAALVAATADRLVALLAELVEAQGRATVALTGGSVGIELLAALVDREVDWSRMHLTWSDERFVAADSPDRNARQAREALLDRVPIPAGNVHELPAAGSASLDEAAAAATAMLAELGTVDLTLLGMGPDAHVASLFPGLPGVAQPGTGVIAVRDSPKPPPERLSFTVGAIGASDRVWLVVAGADKAEAVALARSGASPDAAPAAAAHGRVETLWLLDDEAAALLEQDGR
ncbi:6-phosphogluconolactonase [Agrococcus sediminis]|uniref:6-phosphogluconolactonase n=1 Tax=Agrococcus TaxID=46352 RepID=UPI001FF49BFF|nr:MULTISPECIES: 6-phosphogluconolactonase [unclassified Agrococcus]MDR7234666.1 6-phosphogluconolactonase [Agrococcus sp. BE272]UOW00465.1 6-phosphogluconolactonase [Agrococcus sp. SCSIO52902]